jgi:NitT/TauT family transport system permease protein
MTPDAKKATALRTWTWIAMLLAVMVLWQLAGATSKGRWLISQPSLILRYAQLHASEILRSAMYTAVESFLGMLGATLFSLGFGLGAVYLPRLANIFYPWLLASQVVPFVCLAPLVILMFGPGPSGKIFLSALMSFFPIVTNVLTGMREVPSPPLELMRMMKAKKQMVIRHVFVPHGLPYFFAGLRVAAPFAVIGAIVAEFNGAEWGVGKDIFIAAKRLEPELMMLGILSGTLLSALLYSIAVFSEKGIGDWYQKGIQK